MSVFHDEVEIEDFEYDPETETYYYPCPCGDQFQISKVWPYTYLTQWQSLVFTFTNTTEQNTVTVSVDEMVENCIVLAW